VCWYLRPPDWDRREEDEHRASDGAKLSIVFMVNLQFILGLPRVELAWPQVISYLSPRQSGGVWGKALGNLHAPSFHIVYPKSGHSSVDGLILYWRRSCS
jgi:hypothetical protein